MGGPGTQGNQDILEISIIYSNALLTGAEDLGKRDMPTELGNACPRTSVCQEETWTRADRKGGGRLV